MTKLHSVAERLQDEVTLLRRRMEWLNTGRY